MTTYLDVFESRVEGLKEQHGSSWWQGFCPFHEDPSSSTPSFGCNPETGAFKCHGCDVSGDAVAFVGFLTNSAYRNGDKQARREAYREFCERYPHHAQDQDSRAPAVDSDRGRESKPKKTKPPAPLPSEEDVNQWHASLLGDEDGLEKLAASRLWSQEVLEDLNIGMTKFCERFGESFVDVPRVTIPIYDENGTLLNVRKYLPPGERHKAEFEKAPKIKGIAGRGAATAWPVQALSKETVLIVEGEPDCIAARSFGFNAICFTSGASSVPKDLAPFQGKKVYVAFDSDSAGQKGARKVAAAMNKVASTVKIVSLGEDGEDFIDVAIRMGGVSAKDEIRRHVATRCKDAKPYEPETSKTTANPLQVYDVEFKDSVASKYVAKRIRTRAIVMGIREQPYEAIVRAVFSCRKAGYQYKQSKNGQILICETCPLFDAAAAAAGQRVMGKRHEKSFDPMSEDILEQIRTSKVRKQKFLASKYGTFNCDAWEVSNADCERRSIWELVIGPEVTNRVGDDQERTVGQTVSSISQRPVFAIVEDGEQIQLNQTYEFTGTVLPQPWDQALTNMFVEVRPVENAIDKFVLPEEVAKKLEALRDEGQEQEPVPF